MPVFKITPTLYNSWHYWHDLPNSDWINNSDTPDELLDSAFQKFLSFLRKEPIEKTELMKTGINFEQEICDYLDKKILDYDCKFASTPKIAERIGDGAERQVKIDCELDGNHLYGFIDFLTPELVIDTKYSKNWDAGKFYTSIQHLIYMYGTKKDNFLYLISDGRNHWEESYNWDDGCLLLLKNRIADMIDNIMSCPELSEPFLLNFTEPNDDWKKELNPIN